LGFIQFSGFYLSEQLGSLLVDLAHELGFYLDLPVLKKSLIITAMAN